MLKVVMDQRSDEEQWVGDMDLFEFVYEGGFSSTEITNYFFANGELVAKKNNDGSKVYFHNDHPS